MKRLAALLLGALFLCPGCGSSTNAAVPDGTVAVTTTVNTSLGTVANPLTVVATNQSPMPAARFTQIVQDLNLQLERDFGPAWKIYAHVVEGSYSANQLGVVVSSQGGFPLYAGAPVQSFSSGNTAWDNFSLNNATDPTGALDSACCSHELLQRLGINSGRVPSGLGITDCCGGNGYSPTNSSVGNEGIGPQTLSDFAFPSFLTPGTTGPYDFCEQLTAPLTPLPGGQLIYLAN